MITYMNVVLHDSVEGTLCVNVLHFVSFDELWPGICAALLQCAPCPGPTECGGVPGFVVAFVAGELDMLTTQ